MPTDSKITGFTADTSPTSDDLIVTVNSPAGIPGNKKATLGNTIRKAHGLSDGIAYVTGGVMNISTVINIASMSLRDNISGFDSLNWSARQGFDENDIQVFEWTNGRFLASKLEVETTSKFTGNVVINSTDTTLAKLRVEGEALINLSQQIRIGLNGSPTEGLGGGDAAIYTALDSEHTAKAAVYLSACRDGDAQLFGVASIDPNAWNIFAGKLGIGNYFNNPSNTPAADLEVQGTAIITGDLYFGPPNTNGTWKITLSGNNLSFQRRESGSYVEKSVILP